MSDSWRLRFFGSLSQGYPLEKFWADEILALSVLPNYHKLILQTRMGSHPVGLEVWILVGPFVYFMNANSEGSGRTARMRRLAWAFAGGLCDKYHKLMSWLFSLFISLSSKFPVKVKQQHENLDQ